MTPYQQEHRELRQTVRRLLERSADSAAVRATIERGDGYDVALWRKMSTELGLPGLAISEEHGGAGFGVVELAVVCEEIGRANLPSPYLSTVLGGLVLDQADAGEAGTQLLSGIASGEQVATVHLDTGAVDFADGAAYGTARHVPDAPIADALVLASGNGGAILDLAGPGVTMTRLETMDLTRSQANLSFDGAPIRPFTVSSDRRSRIQSLAAVLLSCEQIGGAERVLEMSTTYASDRLQFGRPVGSFQAVKHTLADMLVELELARSAQQHALALAATKAPMRKFAAAASSAKLACSQAFRHLTSEGIRVHGGIGFTWEHDAHLYFRRARASEQLFGGVASDIDQLAAHAGLASPDREAA